MIDFEYLDKLVTLWNRIGASKEQVLVLDRHNLEEWEAFFSHLNAPPAYKYYIHTSDSVGDNLEIYFTFSFGGYTIHGFDKEKI